MVIRIAVDRKKILSTNTVGENPDYLFLYLKLTEPDSHNICNVVTVPKAGTPDEFRDPHFIARSIATIRVNDRGTLSLRKDK